MLDFDFLSGRSPSVLGIIDPSATKKGYTKLFFGKDEILVSFYPSIAHLPEDNRVDTLINFASFRSASEVTWEALESERFENIIIIAEGIPEREMREIIHANDTLYKKRIIWPATAGALAAWAIRLGNNGWSIENIIESRLYKKGTIGFVSRSGGMSNEMYRVISKRTDGLHTGIALGWDRFVCSTFRDIVLEYEANPEIRMIVLLGEVGSRDEIEVAELLKAGKIRKPLVAHVIGSLAEKLTTEVQFGHAGAKANAKEEAATHKNTALKEAWAFVSESFLDFGNLIEEIFVQHFGKSEIVENREVVQKADIIKKRKATHFTSTISDERGEDVLYNKKPLTEYIHAWSLANVIGNLWLKRDLPSFALDFLNTILILLADHGPAVSGATNTIITARAGKDILSSLIAGLLTIGPRFGGAIDGAARYFYEAVQNGDTPEVFIARMKKTWIPIPGIGHKVKSKFNPDGRCEILREKAQKIPQKKYLEYALSVEALTLEKKPNLILNVDGHIAVIFLDIFESIGMSSEDIRLSIDSGIFNAFFILARSIGFIGHALDQKRLGEPLYRSEWDDIAYVDDAL